MPINLSLANEIEDSCLKMFFFFLRLACNGEETLNQKELQVVFNSSCVGMEVARLGRRGCIRV